MAVCASDIALIAWEKSEYSEMRAQTKIISVQSACMERQTISKKTS